MYIICHVCLCVCLFSSFAPNSFLYKVGGQHLRVSHVGLEWLDIMVPKFTVIKEMSNGVYYEEQQSTYGALM